MVLDPDQLHPCPLVVLEDRGEQADHEGEEGCRHEAYGHLARAWIRSRKDRSCSRNQPCWVFVECEIC